LKKSTLMPPRFIAFGVIGLCLTGCGEFAYKRGGAGDQFAAVSQDCRHQTREETAYRDCVAQAGWTVSGLELGTGPATSSATPSAPPKPGPTATGDAAPAAVPPSAAIAPSPPPLNPLDVIPVKTWWKAGSGSADLKAAVEICVTKLGPAHRPESVYRAVTRGLYACLGEQGWHGG